MPTPGDTPIASNEVLALFPTVVCRTRLEAASHDPLNRAINARVDAMIAAEGPPARGERLRTGRDLYTLEEFAPLADFVKSNAEGMLSYMMAVHSGIEITACWANVNGVGARHRPHTHPNNLLSGVYYVNTASGSDNITFEDPRARNYVIYPRFKEATIENSAEINLTVRECTRWSFQPGFSIAWVQTKATASASA